MGFFALEENRTIISKGRSAYFGLFCFLLAAQLAHSDDSNKDKVSPTLAPDGPKANVPTKERQTNINVSLLGKLEILCFTFVLDVHYP
jgi:hypothetical protein